MLIKDLLGNLSNWAEIEKAIGENQIYIWSKDTPGNEPIPRHRMTELNQASDTKVKDLEGQIKILEDNISNRDKQLKDLKKSADGNADLLKQIEDLQKSNKEQKDAFDVEKQNLSKKEVDLKKNLAVKEMWLDADVTDAEKRELLVLKTLHDVGLDKIELDESGKIKNQEAIIKPIKESKTYEGFFGKEVTAGQEHVQGKVPEVNLQTQLQDAQKAGNTPQVVAIKLKMAQEAKK